MEASILSKVVLPIALALVMLALALSLTPADFKRVFTAPKAVLIGVALQMLMLPLLGFGVVALTGIEGALAVGVIVIALAPGGVTSNMLSYLARGDLALSTTLTAVVTLVTPFTVPLMLVPIILHYTGGADEIPFFYKDAIIALSALTFVPVAIGMTIRKFKPAFAARAEKPVRIASVLALFLVVGALIQQEWANLPTFFAQTGSATLLLNVSAIVIGFGTAKLLRLDKRQSVTIGIEVGMQNGTMALFVTQTLLAASPHSSVMSIAPAIYSLIMFGTGFLFVVVANKFGGHTEAAPVPLDSAA